MRDLKEILGELVDKLNKASRLENEKIIVEIEINALFIEKDAAITKQQRIIDHEDRMLCDRQK